MFPFDVRDLRLVILFGVGTALVLGASCGRTDLEFSPTGRDGGPAVEAGASGGSAGAGGVRGSGGRVAVTGGVGGGGRSGGGGRGGMVTTGGRSGTGGRAGSGGRQATGGTGGVARDGGVTDAPGPDLPPSTPGKLVCGTEACDTRSQSCCVTIAVGAVGARCIAAGATCGGAALDCDEPADCAGGACCFGLQVGGVGAVSVGSRCTTRAACAGLGRFVVCRSNADCSAPTALCCSATLGVPVCQRTCP